MKKLVIPSILAIIIIFAGIFAFSPINQASTVHANVQNTQQGIIIKSGSGANITDGDTVVIDCDQNFIVQDMIWSMTGFETSESLNMGLDNVTPAIVIDGVKLAQDNGDYDGAILFQTGGSVDVNPASFSWSANSQNENNEEYPPILAAVGAGTNDIVINLFESVTADLLDAGDTLTVTAIILTQSNAVCSVTVNS